MDYEPSPKVKPHTLNQRLVETGGDWRNQENVLIDETIIIFTTLSMSGIDKLGRLKDKVEYLIIDEACQCIEPSTLIPLELGPKRVILVGDVKQLPATTFSENTE